MKPSIGRIVHFNDEVGKTLAAVIVAVVDNVVNLSVWNEFGHQFNVLNVRQGNEPGQWNWPPRV
ncbi:hypothetical protein SAMN05661091_4103 [Paenibacillus uliginis N3/975]|uniref:Uncharacterized protein n=1 Tax=Paenibacillus uliginis N3/975 TaxID=1313296 RepID=A0A1X7HKR9_9BACL|nr:hypothetical protein [Paenibacillus uliginis]SMF88080.1 hypothetical protein SAMN05661091_4103 [Paenibacillus uliginis N3/975]